MRRLKGSGGVQSLKAGIRDEWLGIGFSIRENRQYQTSAALPYFYAPHHHFAFLLSRSPPASLHKKRTRR